MHALSRLIAIDPQVFGSDHWGRRALHTPAAQLPGRVEELFSADAVDELLSGRALRTPFLRMAKDGKTLPEREFTTGGGVGAAVADQVSDERVLRLFADGATIVLQGLHRSWAPLGALARELEGDLGHPVQINAYVTPPQNQGFADHYDVHDVFVLQVSGRKHWRVRPPVHESPLRDQPWDSLPEPLRRKGSAQEMQLDAPLEPGDSLYLPRGFIHSATALGEVSIHLTIGVHTWTVHHLADDLARRAVGLLGHHERLRESLPMGRAADPAAVSRARAALHAAIDAIDDDEVLARLAGQQRAAQAPGPVSPLRSAAALRSGGGAVRLRDGIDARIEGSRIVSRGAAVAFEEGERDAVTELIDEGYSAVLPSGLAGRLLLAGVVVPGE